MEDHRDKRETQGKGKNKEQGKVQGKAASYGTQGFGGERGKRAKQGTWLNKIISKQNIKLKQGRNRGGQWKHGRRGKQ